MSTAASAKKQKNQPALATTGRGAALCIALGIACLTLGCAWLLSLYINSGSQTLAQLSMALQGLCGPLCPGLPILLIWGGAKLMVSARHRVSARNFVIVFFMYLMVLAVYTLTARVSQAGGQPYLDYVGVQNSRLAFSNPTGFTAYLHQAFLQRTSGAGGLVGMLIAYPLWKLLTRIGGALLTAVCLMVLLMVLIRFNPGQLFRSASDYQERRRLRKANSVSDGQAAKPVPSSAVQEAPAPQNAPVPVPEAYYEPAPVYDAQPACAPAPAQDDQGFYPVQPELYDERFPLHDAPAAQPPAAARPVVQQSAEKQVHQERPSILGRIRRGNAAPEGTAVQTPAAQEKPQKPAVPRPASTAQALDDDFSDLPWDEPVKEPSKPIRRPVETKAGQIPAQVIRDIAKPAAQSPAEAKPSAASPAQPAPASDSWASQVRQKAQALENGMPEHTTRKGEAKPVYTDPVMPITGEKIAIKPKEEGRAPLPGAKLDGTSAPKIQQGMMGINAPYQVPPLRLLKETRQIPQADAAQEDENRAQIIENTLRSFGVESEVKQIMHGPSITRFAIQIAPGVKVSRVSNIADNLALELKTKHVRVEAPIQGTNYIGIEVPNQVVSVVALRDVLDSPEMRNNPSPLLAALGKDIAGAPVLCDLSKMPHLLIAGATGSGKSVCINSIVCSLLYRTSPDQVRMIMIDPKQVELSVYNSIPHLLVPVVSDPRKAAGALSWVVQEMLERYAKFSAQNVRNLAGYNKINQGTDQVLPFIVVIIDEMADLMEVCRKDVEESIRRLAALARAAGIYMVLATQRPSVDVITGVIKNNIPSRIAFAVSSGTDSRTIIDMNGAEKLMGKGDMLYKPAGTTAQRVQGCLVTDDEVNAIAEYIGSRYQTNYDPNITDHMENAGKEPSADEINGMDDNGASANGDGSFSDLLRQAIEMAVEDGQSSTSMLQRRLRVGYARAGRLIDEMEKRGVISHSEGSKPRKTLITREEYYSQYSSDE